MFGDEDDRESSGAAAGIVVERGPLIEDKIFVEGGELHVIDQHLQDAYSTLGEAVSVYRDLDRAGGQYRDEGTFVELDSLTLDALGAIERAWGRCALSPGSTYNCSASSAMVHGMRSAWLGAGGDR